MKTTINLFAKELKLVIPSVTIVFTILAGLVCIPHYPVWVSMLYCIIPLQIALTMAKANKDMEFTLMLPLSRNDIVLGRHFIIVFIEMLQIIVAIPFALLANYVISPMGNDVGISPNITFFGLIFFIFGIVNLIFLPWHFKSGYKSVAQMLISMVAYALFVDIVEICLNLIYIDGVKLNMIIGMLGNNIGLKLAILGFGILFYIGATVMSYYISIKNFQKVNL